MSRPLVVAAPAKINLFLHVGGKRPDGYHYLQSLVAFTVFGDEISLEVDDGFSLSLSGPFSAQLSDSEENLALKAAKLLAEKTGEKKGAQISLRKKLPVASGLGGGSADAAAVLRGLGRLWQFGADQKVLLDAAAALGADVPVCIASETSWIEGKGERVRRLTPIPKAGVLLVNPSVQVSTAQAFAALGRRRRLGMSPPEEAFEDVYALVHFLRDTGNDLEEPAREIAPVIADVLQELNDLQGALFARMSGSGATCFALFVNEEGARNAALLLRPRHPEWWICETEFGNR